MLVNFSGPGRYKSGGWRQVPNSTFITVAPVPEDLTTVSVPGQNTPGYWINSRNFQVKFTSTPPSLPPQDNSWQRRFKACPTVFPSPRLCHSLPPRWQAILC